MTKKNEQFKNIYRVNHVIGLQVILFNFPGEWNPEYNFHKFFAKSQGIVRFKLRDAMSYLVKIRVAGNKLAVIKFKCGYFFRYGSFAALKVQTERWTSHFVFLLFPLDVYRSKHKATAIEFLRLPKSRNSSKK